MIEMTQEIFIPASRKKYIMQAIGSASFIVLGVVMYLCISLFADEPLKQVIIKIGSVLSILFFSFTLVIVSKKLRSKNIGLVINQDGFHDTSAALNIGFVYWKDVTGFKEFTSYQTKNLVVIVKNPQQYINNATGYASKKIAQANNKLLGSPVALTATTLTISYEALKKLMTAQTALGN
jgi:hypothetical protein